MLRECPHCYELVVVEPDEGACPECGACDIMETEAERDDWFGLHIEEE